ncbi:hypothetical protein EDB86DRAFT_2029817 [Lactarius hatsudake]|nr:hypothetical protein EDB86DRAFT_2029817 [Lactarius hatsudake]
MCSAGWTIKFCFVHVTSMCISGHYFLLLGGCPCDCYKYLKWRLPRQDVIPRQGPPSTPDRPTDWDLHTRYVCHWIIISFFFFVAFRSSLLSFGHLFFSCAVNLEMDHCFLHHS